MFIFVGVVDLYNTVYMLHSVSVEHGLLWWGDGLINAKLVESPNTNTHWTQVLFFVCPFTIFHLSLLRCIYCFLPI